MTELVRPYHDLLGFHAEPVDAPGTSRLRFEPRRELQNSRGDIHGGVVASLLDAAMSIAVRSGLPEGDGCATVSMTVNYVLPARGTLIVSGHVLRSGRTLASAEAVATDAEGRVVAHAIGTMRVIAARGGA